MACVDGKSLLARATALLAPKWQLLTGSAFPMRWLCRSAAAWPFVVQVADMVRLLDAKEVWDLRNKYARLRPTGWRSDSAAKVPPRCEATRTQGTGRRNALLRSGCQTYCSCAEGQIRCSGKDLQARVLRELV